MLPRVEKCSLSLSVEDCYLISSVTGQKDSIKCRISEWEHENTIDTLISISIVYPCNIN